MFRISGKINEQVVPVKLYNFDKLADDLKTWPESRRLVFVNSMSDTFGEFITDELRKRWHTRIFNNPEFRNRNFLLLTKRIGTARRFYRLNPEMLTDNIWIGCSIGERARLWRLDILREIPAKVRFVSFEPLIQDLGVDYSLAGIDWAIVGGESDKHKPRPMNPAWAERIRLQCDIYGTAFWFKQMGGIGGDGAGGDVLNGRRYQNYPTWYHVKLSETLSSGIAKLDMWTAS